MFEETTVDTDSNLPAFFVIYKPETVRIEKKYEMMKSSYRDKFFLTMMPTRLSASGMECGPWNRFRALVIGSSGW